jgi:hypothetical protein
MNGYILFIDLLSYHFSMKRKSQSSPIDIQQVHNNKIVCIVDISYLLAVRLHIHFRRTMKNDHK